MEEVDGGFTSPYHVDGRAMYKTECTLYTGYTYRYKYSSTAGELNSDYLLSRVDIRTVPNLVGEVERSDEIRSAHTIPRVLENQ